MDLPSLHELLALPREADPCRVREQYGREVVQAMHAGNRRRAVALSAAFEALPPAERQQIRAAGRSARPHPRASRTVALPGTYEELVSRVLLTVIGILAVVLVAHLR